MQNEDSASTSHLHAQYRCCKINRIFFPKLLYKIISRRYSLRIVQCVYTVSKDHVLLTLIHNATYCECNCTISFLIRMGKQWGRGHTVGLWLQHLGLTVKQTPVSPQWAVRKEIVAQQWRFINYYFFYIQVILFKTEPDCSRCHHVIFACFSMDLLNCWVNTAMMLPMDCD